MDEMKKFYENLAKKESDIKKAFKDATIKISNSSIEALAMLEEWLDMDELLELLEEWKEQGVRRVHYDDNDNITYLAYD